MDGKPRSEKCCEFMQKCDSLLSRHPPVRMQSRQTEIPLRTDAQRRLPLRRKRPCSRRRRFGGNHAAHLQPVRRACLVGEFLHAIMPFALRADSAISAVCIPCAAPLIMTEASWL